MEIIQLIGVGLISTILCSILRPKKPDIANFITIITWITIILALIFKLDFILVSIQDLANRTNIPSMYITLIIKLIGIAYLMEFSIQICKDSKEDSIASALELGGKIIVMAMSFPILLSIVEMILNIIP